ncbi:MAG: DUF2062 domain-containing protein [Candidatus Woesearchaeota archaeon]
MIKKRIISFKEKLMHHFHEVIKLKKSPHSIALGFAVGTFISILPTPGLNILLGLLVVLIYEKINKISLFGSIIFWNPLFTIPLDGLSYKIGSLIFGSAPVVRYNIVILDNIYNFTRRFLVGEIITAVFLSVFSYLLVFLIAYYIQNRRKLKKIPNDEDKNINKYIK